RLFSRIKFTTSYGKETKPCPLITTVFEIKLSGMNSTALKTIIRLPPPRTKRLQKSMGSVVPECGISFQIYVKSTLNQIHKINPKNHCPVKQSPMVILSNGKAL